MALAEQTVAPIAEPFLAAPRIKRCTFRRVTAIDPQSAAGLRRGLPVPRARPAHAVGRPRERPTDLQHVHGRGDLPGRRGLIARRRRVDERDGGTPARRPVRRVLSRVPEGAETVIHLRPPVARRLVQPTRELRRRADVPASRDTLSYLALLRVELAAFHPARRSPARRLVSVALVLASRRTGVTRYPAPGSPDVPHAPGRPVARDRPVASLAPRSYPGSAGDRRAGRPSLQRHGRWSGVQPTEADDRRPIRHGYRRLNAPRAAPARRSPTSTPAGSRAGQLRVAQLVVEVGQEGAPGPQLGDDGQRLVDGLVGRVRDVAHGVEDQHVEVPQQGQRGGLDPVDVRARSRSLPSGTRSPAARRGSTGTGTNAPAGDLERPVDHHRRAARECPETGHGRAGTRSRSAARRPRASRQARRSGGSRRQISLKRRRSSSPPTASWCSCERRIASSRSRSAART